MTFEERDGQLFGHSGSGLLKQEWVEVPWTWEAGKWLTAERHYSKGLARAVHVHYLFDEYQGGTKFTLHIAWKPRFWWSRPILHVLNRWLTYQYTRVLAAIDEELQQAASPSISPRRMSTDSHVNEHRLQTGVHQLIDGGLPSTEVERLARFLRESPDSELFRIRPKELVLNWGVDLDGVLSLLLPATRAGLLGLSWDVMCPHCHGVRKESRTLGELREFGRCDICDIDFSATTQESIEITFRVHSEIRNVRKIFYCSAEPAKKPHILLQHRLHPGQTYESSISLSPGRHRLRKASGDETQLLFDVAAEHSGTESLAWSTGDSALSLQAPIACQATLRISHPGSKNVTVVLERLVSDPMALRPSDLFNRQQFRDLFSEESVASGLKLEVGHQTLLFTDIVGSTQLYTTLGDSRAFSLVHSHFVTLNQVIAQHHGAVVKTIGDAMMAGFQNPEDALDAAVAIQQCFPGDMEDPISLRISLHRGICLAVQLESNIDYFGNSVNFTAKMQAVATSGQIVMSDAFYSLPQMSHKVQTLGLETENVEFSQSPPDGKESTRVFLAWFSH